MVRRIQALTYATTVGSSLAFSPLTSSHHHHRQVAPSKQCGTIISTKLDGMSNDDNQNFMESLTKRFKQANNSDTDGNVFFSQSKEAAIETEKAKQKRLLRIAEIESGELRRQTRVAEDKFAYLFLFSLQLLPLLGSNRIESIAYFFGMAVTTVYLGGRQEVIDKPEKVTKDNALYAPIGASLAIGGLYTLLKVGIDITSLYAILVTIFGALAISGEIPLVFCLVCFQTSS